MGMTIFASYCTNIFALQKICKSIKDVLVRPLRGEGEECPFHLDYTFFPFFLSLLLSLLPYSPRTIWVENGCNLGITCDNIYTNLFHKLDMVALYMLSVDNICYRIHTLHTNEYDNNHTTLLIIICTHQA